MTESDPHLTEDDRQALADGSMPVDRANEVNAHLRRCGECAADVGRLETLMTRIHDLPAAAANPLLDELWPSIRSRIDQSKVVSLDTAHTPARKSRWARWAVAAAAAILFAALMVEWSRPTSRPAVAVAPIDTTTAVFAVADSVRSYEHEAQTLLNELELRRAMLRPETVASIDRDLRVIDQAIGELEVAIASDPRNPALRQLLAASFRQKVDVLKRATNAG